MAPIAQDQTPKSKLVPRVRKVFDDRSNQNAREPRNAPFERLFAAASNDAQFAIDAHLYARPLVLDGVDYEVLRTYSRVQDSATWLVAVLKRTPTTPTSR